jgi:radical SAM superfamily enzyme YgiQ (UPF0313 family)
MKILLLDPQKKADYRISKDTSGGYGTGNNFGKSIISIFLKKTLKKISDWPPLFAAYTFAVLKKKGHFVVYKKTLPSELDIYDFFIVISSIVCCETEINEIKKLKKLNKNIFVIGPFATNFPDLYLEAGATVISGEPEFYFLNNNNLKADFNKKIVYEPVNELSEIDKLPFPMWDEMGSNCLNIKLYGNYLTLPIIATRGCPFSCFRYCVYPLQQGRKVRQRTYINVVDEIEFWLKKANVRMFVFRDPVFSINKNYTKQLCEEIISRNLNINFVIETHLKILDSDLIKLLKKSGLVAVKVGIESADSDVLKNEGRYTIEKDLQLKKIRELEKNKIKVCSMYIIGFPTDDHESILATIDYSKILNTTYAQFSVWTPYPGTPVFNDFKNRIAVKDYESYDQYQLVYKHDKLSAKEINQYLDYSYSSYYTRPIWIYKYIKSFFNL